MRCPGLAAGWHHSRAIASGHVGPGNDLSQGLSIRIASGDRAGRRNPRRGGRRGDGDTGDQWLRITNDHRDLGGLAIMITIVGGHLNRPEVSFAGVGAADRSGALVGWTTVEHPGVGIANGVAFHITARRSHQQLSTVVGATGRT